MESLISCAICLQYYSDLRRPKVLICGHTFCSKCLTSALGDPPSYCAICRRAIYSREPSVNYNYTLDSMVPLIKNHLSIQYNIKENERKAEALRISIKKEEETELRKKIQKDIKGKIDKEVKEKVNIEKESLSRTLKSKYENEFKNKIKKMCTIEKNNNRLQNTQNMMKEEIKKLKELRKQDRSEVKELEHENKQLKAENSSLFQRHERQLRYKSRSISSLSTEKYFS